MDERINRICTLYIIDINVLSIIIQRVVRDISLSKLTRQFTTAIVADQVPSRVCPPQSSSRHHQTTNSFYSRFDPEFSSV